MMANTSADLFSFRGTPSEPEMGFDETAKAIAMNGVGPIKSKEMMLIFRNASLSVCSAWRTYRHT